MPDVSALLLRVALVSFVIAFLVGWLIAVGRSPWMKRVLKRGQSNPPDSRPSLPDLPLEVFDSVADFPPLEWPTAPETPSARAIRIEAERQAEVAELVAEHLRNERAAQARYLVRRPLLLMRPQPYRTPTHWVPYASFTGGRPDREFIGPIQERPPVLLHFRRHFLAPPGWYVLNDEGRGTPILLTHSRWFWTAVAGPFAFDDLFIDTANRAIEKTQRDPQSDALTVPYSKE